MASDLIERLKARSVGDDINAWDESLLQEAQAEIARLSALVEGKRMFPVQPDRGAKPHPLRIPWSVAEKAYSVYAAQYGTVQSLERLAARGGFAPSEMDQLHPTWREESSEITRLSEALAEEKRLREAEYQNGVARLQQVVDAAEELAKERDEARAATEVAESLYADEQEVYRLSVIEQNELREALTRCQAALRAVEWVTVPGTMFEPEHVVCPWCKVTHEYIEPRPWSHGPDCPRQVALGGGQ